ncbi:hypothetical protein K3495_g2105 [Podosphaera aphanis]|nr:hypothetical protein K3495_g2105 [Podosphaera aphanis]
MKYAFVVLAAQAVAAWCTDDNCLLTVENVCSTRGQDPSTTIPSELIEACKDKKNIIPRDKTSSACACLAGTHSAASTNSGYATTVTSAATIAQKEISSPCALVSSSSSAQKLASPTAVPIVSAQLAYDCLNSVPLNKTAAIQLVDGIEPYLEWQSDTAWKRDPPADYSFPGHDIFQSLSTVKTNLEADHYINEYQFQSDLYQVFTQAHDGHLSFYPDALTKAFDFSRQRSLVSISSDGNSLPVIKLFEDVIYSPQSASVVTRINDVDAAAYISNFSDLATFNQDPDAAYNAMFYEKASAAAGGLKGFFSSGGRLRYIYPGASTTFTFENGTSLTLDNLARVKGDFSNVTTGEKFYSRFCSPNVSSIQQEVPTDVPLAPPRLTPGYPPAVISTKDTVVSGYYIDGEGYGDVAVLSVLAFMSQSISEFQGVAEKFFELARRDGKTKLVIDLSFNPGGYVFQGYDLFRQLFPGIEQDGNTRWRAGNAFVSISEVFSAATSNFDPANASEIQINEAESWFNYRFDLNTSNLPFESFADKFGPYPTNGDNFTNIMRWNLDDSLVTTNATYGVGIEITGYGSRKNFSQPFQAENIVLLHDGFCASTCTIFAQFMRSLAGVKSVAMGGRPVEGPIQGVGGVKGSQVLPWDFIYSCAQLALQNATETQAASLKRLTSLPILRSTSSTCNVRDSILANHLDDGLPAQFVREEADCRLYYTEPMITDVTAIWKAAADAAFNGKKCASGAGFSNRIVSSLGNPPTSTWNGTTQYVSPKGIEPLKNAAWRARHEHKAID